MKMRSKNLLVSFLTIVFVLSLVATVSAADFSNVLVKVDGVETGDNPSITAGEKVTVKVYFDSDVNESDIRVKAEIEGDKANVDATSNSFDVEQGNRYKETLTLEVPYELKDELSDEVSLNIKIWGGESDKYTDEIILRVQRPSYNADIKSISAPKTVEAGESFPVDIVLKNIGYNDLDDVYVTASIPELDVEKTSYFGDIVALECDESKNAEYNYGIAIDRGCNEDDQDTASGRLSLKVPYSAESGIYQLEVKVKNDDGTMSEVKSIIVENDFTNNVIVTSQRKSMATGEDAEYEILLVNPTNKLKVYRIVTESSEGLSTSSSKSVVAVSAGSSESVRITANADSEGEYEFNVDVFSGEEHISTVALSANVEGKSATAAASNPIVVLTVILAIIFVVLLVVLIVLIGKKPEKSEEFGESYY